MVLCFICLSARWICSASFKFQVALKCSFQSSQRHEERKVLFPCPTIFGYFSPHDLHSTDNHTAVYYNKWSEHAGVVHMLPVPRFFMSSEVNLWPKQSFRVCFFYNILRMLPPSDLSPTEISTWTGRIKLLTFKWESESLVNKVNEGQKKKKTTPPSHCCTKILHSLETEHRQDFLILSQHISCFSP